MFPEVAEQAATAVEARLAAGEYDDLDEITLTELLTSHLQEITGDKHLGLRLGGGPRPGPGPGPQPGPGPGGPTRSSSTCGTTGAARWKAWRWCSYLMGPTSTTFPRRYRRDRQFWTSPYTGHSLRRPPGLRADQRSYVSGGREFCYNLQALGRAELIGETTGGVHPTRGFPISSAVHIGIPFARSINPITGTNWQGTGVVQDVAVLGAEAYEVAYGKALRHVPGQDDVPPLIEHEARDALAGLEPGG